MLSLEVLRRLEAECREATGNPGLVLADVFDYIGGTSTGAIIAAGLALGQEVDHLLHLYRERSAEMFDPARLRDRVHHLYDEGPLEAILRAQSGPATRFGSDRLKSLLMVVVRNATTDSPWPLSNNPRARFNAVAGSAPLDLPLWQVVRASTAAPVYFPPERMRAGGQEYLFVDGGVTGFNNPAFQLFLMATLDRYRLCWPTGVDDLLLVSVGTGTTERDRDDLTEADMHLGYHAATTPIALITSSVAQQDLLCRVFGRCLCGPTIDDEVGDLIDSAPLGDRNLFTYVRYDTPLDRRGLDRLGLYDVEPDAVGAIDAVDHIDDLSRAGRALADRVVDVDHVAPFL